MGSCPHGRAAGSARPTPCRRAEGRRYPRAYRPDQLPGRAAWPRLWDRCRKRPDISGREPARLVVDYSCNPFFAVGFLIWPSCRGLGLIFVLILLTPRACAAATVLRCSSLPDAQTILRPRPLPTVRGRSCLLPGLPPSTDLVRTLPYGPAPVADSPSVSLTPGLPRQGLGPPHQGTSDASHR